MTGKVRFLILAMAAILLAGGVFLATRDQMAGAIALLILGVLATVFERIISLGRQV